MIDASAPPFNGNAQAALAALKELGGGRLYLPAGDYGALSAEFASIPNARVTITGDGPATRLTSQSLKKAAYLHVADIAIEGGVIGLDCQDIEQSLFERVNIRWCETAGQFIGGTQTDPNSLTFVDCAITNSTVAGLLIEHPNAVQFLGGSIQYNAGYGLKLKDSGTGYATVTALGTAFEGNKDAGDLVCEGTGLLFVTLSGASFLRTSLGWGTNNIKMEAGSLRLEGVTFRGMAGYTPDAGRPCLDLGAAEIDAGEVHFDHAVEAPSWTGKKLSSRRGGVWGRKSPLGYYAWDCPNGNAFYVGGPFSLGSGLAFGVVNSANTALQPVEWRAAEHLFTGPVRLGPHDPVANTIQVKDSAGNVRLLRCL